MNYIIVLPEAGLTSEERAKAISEELFKISRPPHVRNPRDVSRYVFGWSQHPETDETQPNFGLFALSVDLDYNIYVHPENNLDGLLSLFPEVPEPEKEQLAAYIASSATNRFPFGNIIPSTANVRDKAYMDAEGWFPVEEEPVA
jgi:hypothetical protein